jgi:hypothetical protein
MTFSSTAASYHHLLVMMTGHAVFSTVKDIRDGAAPQSYVINN